MTKTQEILEYQAMHPNTPQRDIALSLGFSRQVVSYVFRLRGIKAIRAPHKMSRPGPACKYCGKEVKSWTWNRNAKEKVHCRYHRKCLPRAMYRGECPVCGKHFERARAQVKRSPNGHPTSGVVVCSDSCRLVGLRAGLYPKNRKGRPKQGTRNT